MDFRHARFDSPCYVVRPGRTRVSPQGVTENIPGLRAQFRGFRFDSEIEARLKGWTDSERKLVEKYLLNHEDFDKPWGFYVLDEKALREAEGQVTQAVPADSRCTFARKVEEGKVEACGQRVSAGSIYCPQHLRLAEEVLHRQMQEAKA